MKKLPHQYRASISGTPEQSLIARADHVKDLTIAPPIEFDGPGDEWSPEALLMASLASCLVLTFRSMAKASGLNWKSIQCQSEGVLAKSDQGIRFTEVTTKAQLVINNREDIEAATALLHKAEKGCFISNSLICDPQIEIEIMVA